MPKKAHKIEVKKIKRPRVKKKIQPKDLLPESREFLKEEPRKTASPSRGEDELPSREVAQQLFAEQIEKANRQKKMIMWSGISFFMVLVFVVWIFNTKQIFQEVAEKSTPEEMQELGDIFQEFNSAMQNVKQGLGELENMEEANSIENKLPVNEEADKIKELKMKLEGQDRG